MLKTSFFFSCNYDENKVIYSFCALYVSLSFFLSNILLIIAVDHQNVDFLEYCRGNIYKILAYPVRCRSLI